MDGYAKLLGLTFGWALGIMSFSGIAAEPSGRPDAAQLEFFESKVRPILVEHCQSCHGAEKQKSNLRLDSLTAILTGGDSGPAVEPGDPGASLLIEAVAYDSGTQMPPKGKLKPAEIAALNEWVKMGAPWPEERLTTAGTDPVKETVNPRDHWAFQPMNAGPLPAVRDTVWPKTAVDYFILSSLESKGLSPVGPAERTALLRRVSFDLTGLPPTPEEVSAFEADTSPDAYAKVVDRLLSSPRYGERWGRHWLDVARYGEDQAHTFQARLYPNGFRYRDWVIKAFNEDMPYDRFVTEQIAGDQLDGPGKDGRLAALGFFALGPVYYGAAIADERDDRIDTLSRGFLGLTVACARCHDHKFDPIPTQDYYSLAGVFASSEYKEHPAAPADVVARYDAAQAGLKAKQAEAETFVPLSGLGGYFLIPKEQGESLLTDDAKVGLKELKREIGRLKKEAPEKYPVIHSLGDVSEPKNLKVAVRGNPENLGDEAPRRFLSVLSGGTEPAAFTQGSGRLELAREIVRGDNPLTARVMVNRIWTHHFGRGIVATPSNFGTLGEPPSHPALLDWLALRFIESGWSVKTIHREILLSAAYQLSSKASSANEAVDAENVLVWRQNRRRLEVEAWRDAMLAVSGELEPSVGGPSKDLTASDNRRRTLYASVSRHNLDNLLRLFDYPDPNITSDRRTVTTVPLQQLFVLNSDFMVRQSRALAARLTSEAGLTDAERVRRAIPIVYGRPAGEDEVALAVAFLSGPAPGGSATGAGPDGGEKAGEALSAWEQYAQALLGSNEFMYVD